MLQSFDRFYILFLTVQESRILLKLKNQIYHTALVDLKKKINSALKFENFGENFKMVIFK